MIKRTISVLTAIILCLSLSGTMTASAYRVNSVAQNLDSYMTALQKNRNFHGSVLVSYNGNVYLQKGYGMADLEKKIPANKDTRYAIGSVTKEFTAMAVMQLCEKGKLSLNDKLSKFIPDFNDGSKISIQNLLTNTSGIADYTNIPRIYSMDSNELTLTNVIDLIKKKPLDSKPGENYSNSNSGYIVLTYIIEKVSGMSYDEYLKKNIFDPIGMSDTGDCFNNGTYTLDTIGYKGFLDLSPVNNDAAIRVSFGAGCLYSTVEDLYKWDRALYTDKLIKNDNLQKMFTGYIKASDGTSSGYGFAVLDTSYGKAVLNCGNTDSFTSVIYRYVDKNTTVIVLTNNEGYNIYDLGGTLSGIAFGNDCKEPDTVPDSVYMNKNTLDNYTGRFILSTGKSIDITTDGTKLYAQLNGSDKYEIYPASKTKFFCRMADESFDFDFNSDGKAVSFSFLLGKTNSVGVKQEGNSRDIVTKPIGKNILNSYTGNYDTGRGFIINISCADGHIYEQPSGQQKLEIFPATQNKFFIKYVPAEIFFKTDSSGKATGIIVKQNGTETSLYKIN